MKANDVGEKAYKNFWEVRIEGNPPVKYHALLTKQKLKAFKYLQPKQKTCKVRPKDIIFKADSKISAHMILVAQTRQLNIKVVLAHPLGPVP